MTLHIGPVIPGFRSATYRLGLGSAAIPSLAAIADVDTGIYWPVLDTDGSTAIDNTVGFVTGGVEHFRLTEDGAIQWIAEEGTFIGGVFGTAFRNADNDETNLYITDDGWLEPRVGIIAPLAGLEIVGGPVNVQGGVFTQNSRALPQLGNLLVNGGMEIWQRGTSFAAAADEAYGPDRWQFDKGGTSAANLDQETSIIDTASRYSLKVAYTHNTASSIKQKLEDAYQLRGRTITVSARVSSSAASAVRLRIDDSAGNGTAGSYHSGGGAYDTLTATKTISAAATTVTVQILLEASATVYIDNVMLVIGSVAAEYLPLTPADDQARCDRYYEIIGGVANEPAAAGECNTSSTAICVLDYHTRKPIAATITVDDVNNWQVVYQNSASTMTIASFTGVGQAKSQFTATVSGTPFTVGQGTFIRSINTSGRIRMEANP